MNTYRVRSGDTLTKIARHFGMKLESLLAQNPQIERAELAFA